MEIKKANRFDYVKYDSKAIEHQDIFKRRLVDLESAVENILESPRARALIFTKLEEAYMWIGKAIRDDQIVRNRIAELQEERRD